GRVAKLAEKHEVDIVILAECSIPPQSMVDALHRRTGRRFNLPFSECEKIVIYTRFPKSSSKARQEGERFTIRRLALPGLDEIVIDGGGDDPQEHLKNSKVEWSETGVTFKEASGHILFIPKEMFIGGR